MRVKILLRLEIRVLIILLLQLIPRLLNKCLINSLKLLLCPLKFKNIIRWEFGCTGEASVLPIIIFIILIITNSEEPFLFKMFKELQRICKIILKNSFFMLKMKMILG